MIDVNSIQYRWQTSEPVMIRSAVALVLAAAMVMTGCATMSRRPAPPAPGGALEAGQSPVGAEAREQLGTQQVEQQIVRRGGMNLEMDDVPAASARAMQIAQSLGGVVERAVQTETSANLVLRLPNDRLEPAMDSIGTLGKVRSRTMSADDVAAETIDLEARLTSLRASRDRIRELLQRAASVAEAVAVERELARVQGQLDSLEGRLKELRSRVAMSVLTAELERRRVLGPLGLVLHGAAKVLAKLFVIR